MKFNQTVSTFPELSSSNSNFVSQQNQENLTTPCDVDAVGEASSTSDIVLSENSSYSEKGMNFLYICDQATDLIS